MTRHYDRPIQVACHADGAGGAGDGIGAPTRLVWRETTYRVRAVLAAGICARAGGRRDLMTPVMARVPGLKGMPLGTLRRPIATTSGSAACRS